MTLSLGSSALAAGLALSAGGRTIAGPGIVNVAKTTSATVMSNYFGNDACVTVLNMGTTDFSLETTGGGVTAVVVAAHQSAALCQGALTSFAINCNGTQSAACHAMWRVDR
jgi:hypothetical protein